MRSDWININDRLPRNGQEVLFTTKYKEVYAGLYLDTRYTETDGMTNEEILKDKSSCFKTHQFDCDTLVTGWMPYPEPYKPDDTEQTMQEQLPYTEEQYQRCLKAAGKMCCAIRELKTSPLTSEILEELLKSNDEFEKVTLDVVNESCGFN